MDYNKALQILGVLLVWIISPALAENIDPYEGDLQYAYGENVGWLNFEPSTGGGAQVDSDKLTGYVWAENIGWINLSCENNSTCATASYGVVNDGSGNLSGYAWGENVGWINFAPVVSGDPTDHGVKIDGDGNFSGWAWGENIGWVNFGLSEYYVTACKVKLEDFANFASYWLDTSAGLDADFDTPVGVGNEDLVIFIGYWLDYCPDGWQLK